MRLSVTSSHWSTLPCSASKFRGNAVLGATKAESFTRKRFVPKGFLLVALATGLITSQLGGNQILRAQSAFRLGTAPQRLSPLTEKYAPVDSISDPEAIQVLRSYEDQTLTPHDVSGIGLRVSRTFDQAGKTMTQDLTIDLKTLRAITNSQSIPSNPRALNHSNHILRTPPNRPVHNESPLLILSIAPGLEALHILSSNKYVAKLSSSGECPSESTCVDIYHREMAPKLWLRQQQWEFNKTYTLNEVRIALDGTVSGETNQRVLKYLDFASTSAGSLPATVNISGIRIPSIVQHNGAASYVALPAKTQDEQQ